MAIGFMAAIASGCIYPLTNIFMGNIASVMIDIEKSKMNVSFSRYLNFTSKNPW
jgi:hypothetical protein